jgi:signal transduction histidine kinase
MGLAIVKKLIESFEGTIEITANQPRGAIFTFTWPAKLIPS